MKNIFKLLGKSPFKPMQKHVEEVANCVGKLSAFLKALKNNYVEAVKIAKEISEFEHNADKIKDEIRNNLGKSLMLPVKRSDLLTILSIQDAIADTAEDISVLATMKKKMNIPDEIYTLLDLVLEKSIETFNKYKEIIDGLDELVEATFAGPQAEKMRKNIGDVCYLEHEADKVQKMLLVKIFEYDEQLSKSDFFILAKLCKGIGDLANISESSANKIRLILLG